MKPSTQSRRPAVIEAGDRKALSEFFSRGGQILLPLLEVVEETAGAIDEVIDVVGRATIEAVLELSAQQVAGPKAQGRRDRRRPVGWYGSQQGEIALSDRKLKVQKPRLRRRGVGAGGEVPVPAYERLKQGGIADRVLALMMRGVSTRNYPRVLRQMADSVGVSKSQVSREWVAASAQQIKALQTRRLEQLAILVVYVDGMVFGDHHVLAAVGVDRRGAKHVLGLVPGSSENYHVAKDLLADLVARGLDPRRLRLFVIDGAKALRKAIRELFGPHHPIQRCRAHKLRNVVERLPKELAVQVRGRMRAAYQLGSAAGIQRLQALAAWLQERDHPDAARSLREGLEESFTINHLGLPATLRRCLASTNIIENPHSGVRRRTSRVTHWQDSGMILRWCAAGFLECEQGFRKIMGYHELPILETKLQQLEIEHGLVQIQQVA